MSEKTATASSVAYRKPRTEDGPKVWALIDECKPLDLNSLYCYLLVCTHFADTSVVAEVDGEIAGFISGYRKPAEPDVLFIWQVAVGAKARGRGVGKGMLREAVSRPFCEGVRYMETSITPSNKASWAMFESFAREREAECSKNTLFPAELFGAQGHEEEQLLRIGPF